MDEKKGVYELFRSFFDEYYRDELQQLAENYPHKQRSLVIDYQDLEDYHPQFATDIASQPSVLIGYAEEALAEYEPISTDLSEANIRIDGAPTTIETDREHDNHISNLVSVRGLVTEADDPCLRVADAALRCELCGTVNYLPDQGRELDRPRDCKGCERAYGFEIVESESEFTDSQQFTIHSLDANPADGDELFTVEVDATDDIVGVSAGEYLTVTGILRVKQNSDTTEFKPYIQASSISPINPEAPILQTCRNEVMNLETFVNVASETVSTLPENTLEPGTKAKLITPFVEALGWDKYDNSEWVFEYSDSMTELRVDYALFGGGSDQPNIVIEAKRIGKRLTEHEQQIYDYLRIFDADYGVLTNGEQFNIYTTQGDNEAEKFTELSLDGLATADVLEQLRPGAFEKPTDDQRTASVSN